MILLVNPPFYRFLGLEQDYVPLSLLAVGSFMDILGERVVIKNMEVGPAMHYAGYSERADHYDQFRQALDDNDHPVWREFRDTVEEIKPRMIGLTVLNVKYRSALKLIDLAGGIPVIVGGAHPTIEPDVYPKGVRIVRGEWESTERLANLDDLPLPNYDLLLDRYSPDGYGHLMASRGCPFDCGFCASRTLWGRRVTFESPASTVAKMRMIRDRFGTKTFTFWDETFTVNKRRLAEFCRLDPPAAWRCDTRADSVDDESVAMMRAAGCQQMSIGIECADNDILQKIGKNETTDDFRRAAEILNRHGVQWKAYMIIGFPFDTVETIRRSVEFVKRLGPFRITLSFFTPYRGTPLFDTCREMGLIGEHYDLSLFSHQSPHNYFCPLIDRERYAVLKREISAEVDQYNQTALETWR